jgi:hypothetical protein
VLAKRFYRPIKRIDRAVGSGEHDAAFHSRKDVGCQIFDIGPRGQLCSFEAITDGADPSTKILGDEISNRPTTHIALTEGAFSAATPLLSDRLFASINR